MTCPPWRTRSLPGQTVPELGARVHRWTVGPIAIPGPGPAVKIGCMSSDPTSEDPGSGAITRLLERAAAGDATAADGLLPMVYERLREIARRQLAGESGQHTLSPTDLVHEAFLSFHREDGLPAWNDRAHFFRYAATAMRHIVIDHARRRHQ